MPTETYVNFRNRLVPHIRIQGDPLDGIFTPMAVQKYRLGTQLEDIDGNIYRYAKAGGTLTAGALIESAALGGAATTDQEDLAVATASSAGNYYAYATILTTNQGTERFIDGYYIDIVGRQAYKIKSHPDLLVGSRRFEFYEPVRVTIEVGSNKVRLLANPYYNVTVAATTPVGGVVGIAPVNVPSGHFFWLQISGLAVALAGAAISPGVALVRSTTVAGAVTPQVAGASSLATEVIGHSICTIDNTDYGPIFLNIRN